MEIVTIVVTLAPFLTVFVALIGQFNTIVKQQQELRADQKIIKSEVKNTHETNLRHDMDEKHAELKLSIDSLRVSMLNTNRILSDHIERCNNG